MASGWLRGVQLLPVIGLAWLLAAPEAHAQSRGAPRGGEDPPPQAGSRGENFSARPPAQLFQSDCTGAGCHSSPRGLVRSYSSMTLPGFLREHYTNSRESASALAAYLLASGAAQPDRPGRPGQAAAPAQQQQQPQPPRPPRSVARTEEPPPAQPSIVAEPPRENPAQRGNRRGRQAGAPPEAGPAAPPAAAVSTPAPAAPQQFDIFD